MSTALRGRVAVLDIYCRISVDYDGTLRSVESQEEDCRDAMEDHPEWSVGEVFRDHAKSAWNPKVKRPEWERLMARLEAGEADGVMVYDLTRFARQPRDGERLMVLAERGVIVTSLTTKYDLLTGEGRKAFRSKMVDAAFESDQISDRSSRGKLKKARRGRPNNTWRGFGRPGYLPNGPDWMPGDPRTPVPEDQLAREQAAVRDAATTLLAGGTMASIVAAWNEAGLRTVFGNRWSGSELLRMLTAPSVTGLAVHRGEVVGELEGEPLLDRDTWDRLLLRMASRKRGRPATAYLLSGMIACGRCGARLYGRPNTSNAPYPDGEVRRTYHCQVNPKAETGCGGLSIDQRFADLCVEKLLIERISNPAHADRLARVVERTRMAQQAIKATLQGLNEDADALASKAGTPGWSAARLMLVMDQYGERIAAAERELALLGDVPEDTQDFGKADADADWYAATLLQRRAMIKRAFPEGLTIRPAASRGVASQDPRRIVPGTYGPMG